MVWVGDCLWSNTMPRSTPKSARDNRANQLNPTHPAYHRSRGVSPEQAQSRASHSKAALDNHANQLNPNNDAHRASRGQAARPARRSSSNRSSGKPE